MATPIPYALVNGVRHDFSSIKLKMKGLEFVGFKSIEYSRTRSRALVRGNHPDPIAKTRGTNEYKCTIEVYLAEFNLFQSEFGEGYGDESFSIESSYEENGFDTITDLLNGCTLDTTEASGSSGSDPLTRKFEVNPLKILFNGIDDVANPLQGVQT